VVTGLFDRLPANGSEFILFDVNRTANVGILLRNRATNAVAAMLPPAKRAFRTTVIANATPASPAVVARSVAPGATEETVTPLGVDYPRDVYSLSHIAMPFPPWDSLYGSAPVPEAEFGVSLGNVATRGENGVLIVGLDTLLRNSSNPFYAYVAERISEGLEAP
jgi:hypothetical protein